MLKHLLPTAVAQIGVVAEVAEDFCRIARLPQAGTRLDELVAHLVDDLAAHGVQFVGGVRRRGVKASHRPVHVLPVGEEADAGMVVVTSEREDVSPQSVSVAGEGGADVVVDGLGHRPPEAVVLDVGAADTTEIGVGDQEVELRNC